MTDECTFSGGWLQTLQEPAGEGVIQMESSSDKSCSPHIEALTKNYL